MPDERDRGGEAPQQPQERKIEALPGESFQQYLKRISSMPRGEGQPRFVRGGPEIGPILIFRSQTPGPTEPAESTPGVRELTDNEGFNRLGGLHVERIETEHQRVETEPPAAGVDRRGESGGALPSLSRGRQRSYERSAAPTRRGVPAVASGGEASIRGRLAEVITTPQRTLQPAAQRGKLRKSCAAGSSASPAEGAIPKPAWIELYRVTDLRFTKLSSRRTPKLQKGVIKLRFLAILGHKTTISPCFLRETARKMKRIYGPNRAIFVLLGRECTNTVE